MEMMYRELSLTISYSNGRVPIQCSLRMPVDAPLSEVKVLLNELDSSFNLNEYEIQLAKVVNNNVYEVYEPSDPLTVCSTSDLTVFVLSQEGKYLGYHGYQQYRIKSQPKLLTQNQKVCLRKKGEDGEEITGIIRDMFSDFCFSVELNNGKLWNLTITDLNCDEYMLRPGDYVFFEEYSFCLVC